MNKKWPVRITCCEVTQLPRNVKMRWVRRRRGGWTAPGAPVIARCVVFTARNVSILMVLFFVRILGGG